MRASRLHRFFAGHLAGYEPVKDPVLPTRRQVHAAQILVELIRPEHFVHHSSIILYIAHRIAVKDEPISVIHGESHQVPSPPSTPWRLHLLFHAMSGCVLALLHAFLQLLFVSVVDRIHQCSSGLSGDGMEGVVIHRLAVFLVGLLGHGDEAALVPSQ